MIKETDLKMTTQKGNLTLSIIKPNAVRKKVVGSIIREFESRGVHIVALKFLRLSQKQCEDFYREHEKRAFFQELVSFMSSGPVLVMALSGENVVQRNRELMGATDPAQATKGTLRFQYGDSLGENAIHGSDSESSAQRELDFFFSQDDYVNL